MIEKTDNLDDAISKLLEDNLKAEKIINEYSMIIARLVRTKEVKEMLANDFTYKNAQQHLYEYTKKKQIETLEMLCQRSESSFTIQEANDLIKELQSEIIEHELSL